MIKRFLDFYIHSSLHVALSVFALIQVTGIRLGIPYDAAVSWFGFFGTVVGYNFVKYDAIARQQKLVHDTRMKGFIALSFLSFLAALWFFLKLEWQTRWISVAVLGVTALYTLPFFPNRSTARDWAGLKIYFVALCWVGVTVLLPALNVSHPFSADMAVMSVQRFVLVVVLLFVFEIIDLSWDDPHLKTVPQQIGVKRTKQLGLLLMVLCLGLEFLKTSARPELEWVNMGFVLLVSFFLMRVHQGRSRYYSTFWTELLPVFWWAGLWLVSENT